MKFILAPLATVATLASLVAAAAPDNEKTIDYSKYAIKGPTPVLSSSSCPPPAAPSPTGSTTRTQKDNKYDLSVAKDAEEALAAAGEDGSAIGKMAGAEYATLDLDSKVSMSVYLDKDGKVVRLVRNLRRKLDPNTPGIEDLKDPGSMVAQVLLNKLALEGPDALEDAKNDPNMVKILDGLYDSAYKYYEEKARLEAEVAEEEKQNQAGKKEERHNKPHHHHHNKAPHKKKN
ncbi:hypothetical protein KI688_012643 [Linnemannia hyalina]|uniref:Uncharacterized protein n=1 Tax=Linnemannia hyalina TaxID=64524 RepID=A0A9P7XVM5_9FUNG|nr:hypothetical protein KI688_012643 [Linnemannia hyalina]